MSNDHTILKSDDFRSIWKFFLEKLKKVVESEQTKYGRLGTLNKGNFWGPNL